MRVYIYIWNSWKYVFQIRKSQEIKNMNMWFILIHAFHYIFLNFQVIFKFHIQDIYQNS